MAQRRQINIRMTEETEARLKRLIQRMREELGIEVSQSDVFHAALLELEKRYPPKEPTESSPAKKTKKGEK